MNQSHTANQSMNLSRPAQQRLPKTGQYIETSGSCFNAATTPIIRIQKKAVND